MALADKKVYPALTGLRAIAAYLVFAHHYPKLASGLPIFFVELFSQGSIGVTIFYVLSGFLIHQVYGDYNRLKALGLKKYFRNRFARLYPLYFLVCIVSLLVAKNGSFSSWLANITLVKGFFDNLKFDNVAQAWSLTVEECFYAAAPLIFFLRKKEISKRLILLTIYFTGGLFLLLGSKLQWYGFFGNFRFVWSYTFFGRAFEFIVGILCSELLNSQLKKSSSNKRPVFTSLGICGIFLCMGILAWAQLKWNEPATHNFPVGLGMIVNNLLAPIPIALLIYGLIVENTIFSRVLSSKVFSFLGKSSYAFYLLQQGPLQNCIGNFSKSPWFAFSATIVISGLIFAIWEEPINNLIRGERESIKKF